MCSRGTAAAAGRFARHDPSGMGAGRSSPAPDPGSKPQPGPVQPALDGCVVPVIVRQLSPF
ncbi:hypothetical protein LK07_13640 [Streptomyces pluripotens]|uniref:Uncharacterized protein n=1 Tax=Streptomyces pluripotens TaxID=1355015 RepID=A0A221NZG9_9ACTN|nr:hypothetical protein [Streptomyces pluripotens]ARP70654.1 hypothetical protein LK06_012510 [Streptomyces pluripotens]ASN24915.1 hypothetical protein LK07_13640 [Streptomyces pluripotens]